MNMDISGNRRRININMDNLCIGRKSMEFTCDSVIESCSDGEKEITLADRHIRRILAMHSEIADIQRMTGRYRTPSHDRRYHRHVRLIYNFRKYLICPGNIYTAARKEKRLFRLFEHFEGTFQLSHMHACIRFITADINGIRIVRAAKFTHHIFRKVDEHWSRTSCPRDIKRLFDNTAEIFAVSHCHAVFCDAARDSHDIHFLKRVISDQVSCHLPCKADKRNTVIVCRCKSCDQIGGSRSACHQTHAYLSSCPRISICLVNERLLMAGKDHFYVVLFIQLVADINSTRTRISEDCVHSFFF